MVPRAGLEPARVYTRGILSPLRLPIPPSRHTYNVEAAPGFEPGIKVLQTRALPLGYAATTIQLFTRKKVNILNVAENSYSASFTPL